MASIVDYGSLVPAVANWMMRAGNGDFIANIPDFVSLGEGMMNFGYDDGQIQIPPLRVSQMEVAQTTFTVLNSTNTVGLPGDYLEMRRLYLVGNQKTKLTYVTPTQIDSALANAQAGPQAFYTIMGSAIYLPANVNTTQTLVGGYYQKIPSLQDNGINWLILLNANVYLSAALLHANLFLGNDDDAAKWGRIFSGHTRSLQRQDNKARHSGDVLQMKTDVGNP